MTPPSAAVDPAERIVRRLCGFVATLRENGFAVGTAETADALRVLERIGTEGPGRVRPAFRALFARDREQWQRFDALFDAWWLPRGRTRSVLRSPPGRRGRPATLREIAEGRGAVGEPSFAAPGSGGAGAEESGGEGRRGGASAREHRGRPQLRGLADAETLAEAERVAERLGRRLAVRLVRRQRVRRRGDTLDLRRTIRRSVEKGGLPLDLLHRTPREKPLRLALLVDASGSMGTHVGLFLRFLRGLVGSFDAAEAFLFHTRLVPVTAALRERDPARAFDRLALLAEGVGGGTRIGECLATFNRHHAARALRGRSCAILVSDGYETGPTDRLAREMAQLRRHCRQVIWLDPAGGRMPPQARGLRAALPWVDILAPAQDIGALAALEGHLARPGGRRR